MKLNSSLLPSRGVAALCAGLWLACGAHADILTVLNNNDSGPGSLRYTIFNSWPGDTITFTNTLAGSTIVFTSGTLYVNKNLTIIGLGADRLTLRSGGNFRVVTMTSFGYLVSISGLAISGGRTTNSIGGFDFGGDGAGIYNSAVLILSDCTITGNIVSGGRWGGGIYNKGRLTVNNCTISGNRASRGGGIYNESEGAIFPGTTDLFNPGIVALNNCTVSRNRSRDIGGGIANLASMDIAHCTVASNSASSGGGLYHTNTASLLIANTILAGNLATNGPGVDAQAAVASQGFNLIGNPDGSSGWLASDLLNADAHLGPLTNNGGPTLTHALLPGSPAINAGNFAFAPPPEFDQRGAGFPRVRGGRVDMGAFESSFSPPLFSICPGKVVVMVFGELTPVTYRPTAADDDGPVMVTCFPPSGTGFRLGTSNVVCTASNADGIATCSFTVTVSNQCPTASNLNVTVASGSSANFQLPASDPEGDALQYSVSQAPQHGVVVVRVSTGATSYSANSNYCGADSFTFRVSDRRCGTTVEATVTINVDCGLRGQKRQVLAEIGALRAITTNSGARKDLDNTIEHLQASLANTLWVDNNHLAARIGKKVFDEEKDAVKKLRGLLDEIEDDDSDTSGSVIQGFIDRLVAIDRALAVISVNEAEVAGANPRRIREVRKEIEKGDEDAAQRNEDAAIKRYREAWEHAVKSKGTGRAPVPSPAGIRLHFAGVAGEPYMLEVSSDFIHWSPLARIMADADGNIDYTDAESALHPHRFYRVVQ